VTARRLAWAAFALLVVAVATYFWTRWVGNWVYHPLGSCSGPNCKGYQLWSGGASDVSEITLAFSAIVALLSVRKHYECHVDSCHRIGVHRVAGTHYRTCWRDHPVLSQHPRHKVPKHVIHNAHEKANARGAARKTTGTT
jgi:hypothetical protein